jgi:hypothetical protein
MKKIGVLLLFIACLTLGCRFHVPWRWWGRDVYGLVRTRSGSFMYRGEKAGLHPFLVDNSYSVPSGKIVRLAFSLPRQ